MILAGGSGSRLYPLTRITNNHLLRAYDRPMIYFSVEALVRAGLDSTLVAVRSARQSPTAERAIATSSPASAICKIGVTGKR
ncbi:MAG: sugar phosphate nucleotidyltransferase [Longimicrobiales bacterium]